MPVVQLLLAAAACLGLWRLCRAQPKIVIAGFLVRALAGQALFWISYLRLPLARSLQLGDGFWFFAVDGPFYLGYATKLAARGPAAILLDADQYPSQFFVQVLALCAGAFGSVASVAILLNCAAYLLTCAIVVRVARPRNNVVLAAIACSPASILFSMQPLKDTLFLLLIVATVAAFRRWEELWRAGGPWAPFLGYALAMCAALFALGGIRWYFSVIAWGAAAVFLVLTALQTHRKGWAFAASAVLLVLLAQSIRLGAHDLPPSYARLLNPMTALQWRPAASQEHIAEVRKGFDSTPGATTIAEGGALAQPEIVPVVPESTATTLAEGGALAQPEPVPVVPASTMTTIAESEAPAQPETAPVVPASTATTIAEGGASAQPETAPVVPASTMTTIAESEAPAQPETAPVVPASTATTIAESEAPAQPASAPVVPASTATPIAESEAPAQPASAPVVPESTATPIAESEAPVQPESAPVVPASTATTIAKSEAPAPPKIAPNVAPDVASNVAPDVAPVVPAPSKPAAILPPRFASRIITGFAAMFLPRVLGESLGLIHVGGGRGLWLFAEVDTLLFDLVLLYAIVHCWRALRRGRAKMTATFVFCVLVFVMTAGPMLYTVNNFGTLFRLRLMVYCLAAILPITLREQDDAVQ